jgi:hypothetical protein
MKSNLYLLPFARYSVDTALLALRVCHFSTQCQLVSVESRRRKKDIRQGLLLNGQTDKEVKESNRGLANEDNPQRVRVRVHRCALQARLELSDVLGRVPVQIPD